MSSGRTVRQHVLCTACKSFWEKATCLNFTHEALSRGGEQVPLMPQYLLHSTQQSQIKVAASSGCHFCSIILGSIEGCTGDHHDRESYENDSLYVMINALNPNEGTFVLTFFPCEQSRIEHERQILNGYPLRLRPTKGDTRVAPASSSLGPSHLQSSTFSKEVANSISSWVNQCKQEHTLCWNDHFSLLSGLERPPARPRRLLDLQAFHSPDKIRLVEAEDDLDSEYCTLSYSWGFSTPYVMTSSNMSDFQKEIRVEHLPKLLRDAIEIIRSIGFRYMWIDALCIMQDGSTSHTASEDWFDQAGKMNDIFGGSVLTLAASEAFDGNQSLIVTRNPLCHTICRLDSDTDLSYEVLASCTPNCKKHYFYNARYHLDTRAWVFQERILSPRTVHITRNFIHLECRTELKCEAMSETDCHHSGAVAKADYLTQFAMFGLEGLDSSAVGSFLNYWHELIRRYSVTNLSRAPDLLVALAGLAKQIQERSRLTWSFGLWREHMLRDMLWYVRGGKGLPQRERAPSWSWASIEVKGPHIIYDESVNNEPLAKITALPEISDFVRQPPLSTDESRYSVKIAGRLTSSKDGSCRSLLRQEYDTRVHRNCEGLPYLHPECPFHPDYGLPDGIKMFNLLLARVSSTLSGGRIPHSWTTEVGIVLTPVLGYPHRYRRVGYFHHDMRREVGEMKYPQLSSLFEDVGVQEVEIV